MKYLAILLLLLIFIIDKGYSQNYVIASQDGNILYVGFENSLRVSINEYSCSDYYLKTDNGRISRDKTGCGYSIIPEKSGTANISVYLKKHDKKIGVVPCRVREIPAPVAIVANLSGGIINKSIFENQLGIIARLPATTLQANFRVQNYTITVYENETTIYSKSFEGNTFPAEVIEMFKLLKSNSRVLFSNMNYISANKKSNPLAPIEFVIE
ncbi:hypothetical protein F0919_14075 [Taibaiella lutea]|uniref:Uncharacterized protein n=1 Tax=Taibaiella lutea TaxID=2608001 RepID=A0A5M6CGV9_9BACT|nr:GldM family protein [Taibaiella lutea]KAA5533660.1 hypothetical protein F0919_14075 [Taibaiella lutea]